MKKLQKTWQTGVVSIFIAAWALSVIGQMPDETTFINLPAQPNSIAANSTNTTTTNALLLAVAQSPVTIFLSAIGTAGTTNTSGSSLTVKLSIASGVGTTTNEFTSPATSQIKLSMTNTVAATATNVVSDWFSIPGARYIRVGQIENTYNGNFSNITVRLAYPK